MKGIPLYEEINEIHEMTGSALRTLNPLFHCFDMAQANDLKVEAVPPHRAAFFTLALSFGTEGLSYQLNENVFDRTDNFILCVAPGQVATWEKKGNWLGYCIFFKAEFLHFAEQVNFLQQYPFFNIQETNLIPLEEPSFRNIKVLFEFILEEQAGRQPFSDEICRSYFQSILWKVRRVYERESENNASQRAGDIIAAQFQYLVNERFLERTRVEDYADMLNISANHLTQTIKHITGKSAKSIINERRLNEAKYLLRYTDNQISEIAYHLQFSEPTHFGKFFKKAEGRTPLAYRNG